MTKTVLVLTRRFRFRDGTAIQFPLATFVDKAVADREAQAAARSLSGMATQLKPALEALGIVEIGHGLVETPFTDGSGLVLVPAGVKLPPPPGAA